MDRPHRRYVTYTSLFMGVYVALNVAAIFGAFDKLVGPSRWVLSSCIALPIAGQIWATLSLIRDSDEFVRSLMARRFIIASGLAFAAFSAWGFAESYAAAPHAPGWLIYPLFWLFYGAASPFMRSTRG